MSVKIPSMSKLTRCFLACLRCWSLILFVNCQLQLLWTSVASGDMALDILGPVFEREPPDHVDFSSLSGVTIPCVARGAPRPSIKWLQADGNTVAISDKLRRVANNGSLIFLPFQSEDYRPDVHATVYRCVATSSIGVIVSREIHIKAVVPHPPDIQVYHVHSIVGSTAVLRCHVPTILTDYVHVKSWIRDGKLWIESSSNEHKEVSSSKYLIMNDGELHILNVQMTESGSSYQCKAVNRLTGEMYLSTTAGKVFVTVPQGNVQPEVIDTKPSMTVKEGETVVIPCATQGYPLPITTWYGKVGGGQLHPLLSGERFQKIGSGLLIRNVQVSDSGAYVCDVINDVGNKKAETVLTVTAKLQAEIQPKVLLSDLGKSAIFKCSFFGNPVTSVRWLHNGKWLPVNDVSSSPTDVLRISEVRVLDKGMYQCFISNSFQSAQATAELRLQDATPQFLDVFDEKVLVVGQSVSLKCVIFGIPPPQVTWHLDYNSIRKTNNSRVEERMDMDGNVVSVLHLQNANVKEAGLYQCTAANKLGRTTHSSRINVHGPPFGRPIPKQTYVAGITVYVNCPVYGYPIQIYQWEKDGRLLPLNLRQAVYPNGTLVIEKVKRAMDAGRYTCSAWNKNGQRAQVTVHIDISVPPKITPFSFQDQLIREGMRARLQCVVSDGDLPIRISWLKDGHPINPDIGVSVRDLDEFSSILTIAKITPKNNGNYSCTANNGAGTSVHTANLFVNVAPKITPFSFQGDPLLEGSVARLSCVVYQGDLPITIEWLKDDRPLADDPAIKVRDIDDYSSILTIDKVSRRHSGTFTCKVRNNAAATQQSAILVVNVPPKIVPFSFQDEHLLEGMLARVSCVVSRGDLPLRITWEKDRQAMPATPNFGTGITVRNFDEYSSILSIDSVKKEHSGMYTCVAGNDAGSARFSTQLIVNVPPRWLVEPRDTSVALGHEVIIHCQSEGSPQPVITWMKAEGVQPGNRKDVIVTTSRYHLHNNGSLGISNVQVEDEGYYFCQASNGIDEGLSMAMHLYVNVPPQTKAANGSLLVQIRQNITLACYVTGDEPLDVTWSRNDSPLPTTRNSRYRLQIYDQSSKSKASQLIIRSTHRDDTAIFTCSARNTFGSDSANISVIIQETPDTVKKIKLGKPSSRSVDLAWSHPFDGNSPITGYTVEFRPKEIETGKPLDSKNITTPTEETVLTLNDLRPATQYQIRLFAHNKLGQSNASQVLDMITAEEVPAAPPREVQITAFDTHTVKVTWKPPKPELHNGKLRGYRVGYKIQNMEDPYVYKNLDITNGTKELSVQIGNLKKFTIYEFIVEAYNGPGRGPASDILLAATAEDVPGAPPQDIRCTPLTAKSIHMTWLSPPALSINGILLGYRILYRPIDEWYDLTPTRNLTVKTTKYTIDALLKFANYSLQVLAFTKAGDGVGSEPVYCRTLDDFPDAPESMIVATTHENSVIVAWKRPLQANGILKQFDVYMRKVDSPMKDVVKYTTSPTDNQYEITGLRKDHRYEFWVTASTSVGEGKATKVINHSPVGPMIPVKIVSFSEKLVTTWKSNLTLLCKAVGIPSPDQRWFNRGKLVKSTDHTHIHQDGSLTLYNIRGDDAGTFTCQAKNENGEDKIVYDVHILEPPHPPEVIVIISTLSSIEIKWKQGKTGGLRIEGYILQYKTENEPHQKVNISKDAVTYKIDNLKCGTKYQISMAAYNRLGVGLFSTVVENSTDGTVPTAPEKFKLIEESTSSAGLHLSSWISNGCPIQKFTIEFKIKSSKQWQTLADNVKPEDKHFHIPSLTMATWYNLRMTAENSAGQSVAKFEFATLTSTGGTIAPETVADQGFVESTGLLSDWDQWLIIAAASAVIALVCVLVVTCLCVKRKKRMQRRKRDKKTALPSYANSPITNQEMAMFTNPATSPTESDPGDGMCKPNGQTPQRFARPKPYQSGFRTPTHDAGGRGLRIAHPVPIPTAPDIKCNGPLQPQMSDPITPTVNFDTGPLIDNGKLMTLNKSNNKSSFHRGDSKQCLDGNFILPPLLFEDVMTSSSTQPQVTHKSECSYENVLPPLNQNSTAPPTYPGNYPVRPKLIRGILKMQ